MSVASKRNCAEELVVTAFFVSKVNVKLEDVLKKHFAHLHVITFNCFDFTRFYIKIYIPRLIHVTKDLFSKYCDRMCVCFVYICKIAVRENYIELLDAITQSKSGLTKPALLKTLSIVHRHPLGPDMGQLSNY